MAFGITKGRFRMFYGKTGVKFRDGNGLTAMQKYSIAWEAACILHNMAVTYNQGQQAPFEVELEDEADGNVSGLHMHELLILTQAFLDVSRWVDRLTSVPLLTLFLPLNLSSTR